MLRNLWSIKSSLTPTFRGPTVASKMSFNKGLPLDKKKKSLLVKPKGNISLSMDTITASPLHINVDHLIRKLAAFMTKRKKGTVLIPKRNKVGLENAFHWYMFSVPLGDSQLIFPAVRWKRKINTRIHTIRSKVLMYMCSCCSKAQEKCETIHFFFLL